MVVLRDGGGGSAGATRAVEVTLAELEEIAGPVLRQLGEDVRSEKARFEGLPVGGGIFGGTPAGRSLAEVHRAAADVYRATVEAVVGELEAMQDRLKASIESYAGTDASAQEVLLRYIAVTEAVRPQGEQAAVRQAAAEVASEHERLGEYAGGGPASAGTDPVAAPSAAPSGDDQFDAP